MDQGIHNGEDYSDKDNQKQYYIKKSLKKWILVYVVIAIFLYFAIYYFIKY